MSLLKNIFVLLFALAMLTSCNDYFGNKTDLDFIDIPPNNVDRQIAYVPILPVLNQFSKPVDVAVGFDELIYVVDEATQEVIALDQAGNEVGRKFIPGAKAIAQDRKFDLLVVGTLDTLLNIGGNDTIMKLATIYRVNQITNGFINLNTAQVKPAIIHPFYFKSSVGLDDDYADVRFNGVAVIANNSLPFENNQFYATREGNGNIAGGFGPRDAVLLFGNNDAFISGISVSTSSGLRNDFFRDPSGITTLAQPPQITAQNGGDFIYTSLDPDNSLKVRYVELISGEFGADYQARTFPFGDTSKADGFLNKPGKFDQPYDITIAGDATRFIFVVDASTDSLYQFTSEGLEGVLPPPATGITKYQKASFGGTGSGVTQFRNPQGVAYFNEILYVADAGNGRILRFKLTTDFE